MRALSAVAVLLGVVAACSPAAPEPAAPLPPAPTPTPTPPAASSSAAPEAPPAPVRLTRGAFNRGAIRLNLPLYWVSDANKNGEVDPDEVASLRFFPTKGVWVEGGGFTDAFKQARKKIEDGAMPVVGDATDAARIKLVIEELDSASPALVRSDLRGASAEERAFAARMLEVADRIDDLYAIQTGARALASQVPADAPSQSLFRRSWGPRCQTPGYDKNPACTAIPGAKQEVTVYPPGSQARDNFCATIEKEKDAKKLLDPFVAVRADEKTGKLRAVPYPEAYREPMKAVSDAIKAARAELKGDGEKALKAYLDAAAKSFLTNDWLPADEAWAKMNAQNSAWYVRVAPDETYWEPCSHKASFHLTFARINPASLRWQQKLTPVQQEMEDKLATHIGGPYKARKVSFHLPDFIDIVVNAGDDRGPVGATIGQSLPNWGKVVDQGRGRTVVMTNLYTDPDSMGVIRAKVESLLDKETASHHADETEPSLISTILHEAAHNLGPAHDYKLQGKKDSLVFGGDLASMLEELKAQTASLWFVSFIQQKGVIDEKTARRVYVDSLSWAFNHISRGMWTASHQRKHYSQLAAIQVGILLDEKALVFDPEAMAANGTDKGTYRLDFAKLPAAIDRMMKEVGHIRSAQDKAAAEALSSKYVDGMPDHHKRIAERCLRHPQPNFVYSVDL